MNWASFIRMVLGGGFAVLTGLGAFVAIMNPYGNLPAFAFQHHVIMDSNQRFQFPALVKSGLFDSLVIGTSTSRLLDPERLEQVFDGSFANLAMDSARAWEQYRLIDLFLRETPHPRTLIIGLDTVWCEHDADKVRTTPRGFPEWMYDDKVWNDLPYMLNGKTVEIAARRLGHALGLIPARIGSDGYQVFTPPESSYDAKRVRHKLWGEVGPTAWVNSEFYTATDAERSSWRFPALKWLDESLSRWPGRELLVFMPVHITAQPRTGSKDELKEIECKARASKIASRQGAYLLDFRIRSQLTTNDHNFWDPLHYRLHIATKVVTEIERATRVRTDESAINWRYLSVPSSLVNGLHFIPATSPARPN